MVAVQLPVGGDHDQRRVVIAARTPVEDRLDPLCDEPVGIDRRRRLERHRGRQRPVVADRGDRATVPQVDPQQADADRRHPPRGPATGRRSCGRSPRRPADAAWRYRRLSRAATSRPDAARSAPRSRASPSGSPSLDRSPRRAAGSSGGMAGPCRSTGVAVDEPPIGDRVAVLQPAGQRRADVPRDRAEIAELGVRSIAVGADALVPVVRRRGRGSSGTARERVETGRLVEVAVDDQRGTGHAPSSRRSCVVATTCVIVRSSARRAPGRTATTAAARCPGNALEPGLRVRHGLDRCPPRIGCARWGRVDRLRHVVVALRVVVRSRAVPAPSCAVRTPPTSHHAAGLPPPPSIVRAHSTPMRASTVAPP